MLPIFFFSALLLMIVLIYLASLSLTSHTYPCPECIEVPVNCTIDVLESAENGVLINATCYPDTSSCPTVMCRETERCSQMYSLSHGWFFSGCHDSLCLNTDSDCSPVELPHNVAFGCCCLEGNCTDLDVASAILRIPSKDQF